MAMQSFTTTRAFEADLFSFEADFSSSSSFSFFSSQNKLSSSKGSKYFDRPLNRSAAKSTHLFEFKVRISFLQVWVCLVAKGSVARWVGCSGKVDDKLGSRLGTGHWALGRPPIPAAGGAGAHQSTTHYLCAPTRTTHQKCRKEQYNDVYMLRYL